MPRQSDKLTFTFVPDGIASAIAQAKAAAGDLDVTIIGTPNIAQQVLRAGLADGLHIDIAPILLGQGQRFFEHLDGEQIKLQQFQVREGPGLTEKVPPPKRELSAILFPAPLWETPSMEPNSAFRLCSSIISP